MVELPPLLKQRIAEAHEALLSDECLHLQPYQSSQQCFRRQSLVIDLLTVIKASAFGHGGWMKPCCKHGVLCPNRNFTHRFVST